jgi:hypothetical protein
MELNIQDIEKFLIFPTVICTPQYDNRFRSYNVLNIDQAAEISGLADLSVLRNLRL